MGFVFLVFKFSVLSCLRPPQMRQIPKKSWRGLAKSFRQADGKSRTGQLDVKTFAYVLSEYGVALTRGELNYASDVSGGASGNRGHGPRIVDFGTLANGSKKMQKVVKYVNFLQRFVEGKILYGSLMKSNR